MSHLLNPESAIETMRALIAGRSGHDSADVCVRSRRVINITAQNTVLQDLSQRNKAELGIRMRKKNKFFSASTSQLDMDGLKDLLRICERNLERIPDLEQSPTIHGLSFEGDPQAGIRIDKTFGITPIEEKINRVLNMGQSPTKVTTQAHIDIRNTYREVNLDEWIWTQGAPRYLHTSTNHGELRSEVMAHMKNYHVRLRATHCDSQYYNLPWSQSSLHLTQLANRLLDASTIPSGDYKIIFEKSVMIQLIQLMADWFLADRILKGRSVFSDRSEAPKFSTLLNLTDDPHQKRGVGSRVWDAEGTPTTRKVLIENGQVKDFLHNLESSAKMKHGSRGGNAFKRNVSSNPNVGFHSLVMDPGPADFVDLLREMQNGIVVYAIRGMESVHPRTGNFYFKVLGMLVENGQETRAVRDILVRGNLVDLFSNIQSIGRDTFVRGNLSAPSVLFAPLTVVGT